MSKKNTFNGPPEANEVVKNINMLSILMLTYYINISSNETLLKAEKFYKLDTKFLKRIDSCLYMCWYMEWEVHIFFVIKEPKWWIQRYGHISKLAWSEPLVWKSGSAVTSAFCCNFKVSSNFRWTQNTKSVMDNSGEFENKNLQIVQLIDWFHNKLIENEYLAFSSDVSVFCIFLSAREDLHVRLLRYCRWLD